MNARDDLWNEAMALLLSWQRQTDDDAIRTDIRAFCARGEDHRAAWEEAKRVFLLTGAASASRRKAHGPTITRRGALLGAAGIVAAGALSTRGPSMWRRHTADRATGVAQVQRSTLPDGSRLTLGPESAVEFAFTPSERRIHLVAGSLLCETADDGRPFVCTSDALGATTRAATFELRVSGGRHVASALAGEITVRSPVDARSETRLSSGRWVAFVPSSGLLRGGSRDPASMAAWRQRRIIAEDERVADVVAEIARWKTGRILVPQPSLAEAQVSGLYDLHDPDAALAAVVAPFGGRMRTLTPWLTVVTTV
jgi:transmembrane sensor